MKKSGLCLMGIALLALTTLSLAQENVLLITYGSSAKTKEGDDDFKQIIFIRVPQAVSEKLYLRLFDADCGGALDSAFEGFDTKTRFRLFGGPSAVTAATIKTPYPSETDLNAGTALADETFGEDSFKDNKWYNFAAFSPSAGEALDGYSVFKLVIEGMEGNDGNLFNIAVSLNDKRNTPPRGLEIFSYAPTIRLPKAGIFAELRFFVPEAMPEAVIHNFDLAQAKLAAETAFRSNLALVSSGQDEWAAGKVSFEKNETGRPAAVLFEGGNEIPNDATFYLTDEKNVPLPFQFPVYIRKVNRRPVPEVDLKTLSDCNTVVFDGSRSKDEDGEALEFFWDFGDGQTGRGKRVAHRYAEMGRYDVEVIVSDASGQVGNSSFKKLPVVVNKPPTAEAGEDLVAAPGQVLEFDGSASADADGRIQRYVWNFGDGTVAEGKKLAHAFQKSGTYPVILRVEDESDSPCNFAVDQLKVWVNAAPVVEIGQNLIASQAESVKLDGGRSFDSDGEIASYLWDFGDGTGGAGQIVEHAYDKPGTYQVTLTVTDNAHVANSTAVDRLVVKVNDRPRVNAGDDRKATAKEVVDFDGTRSSDKDGKIVNYAWDFGDGTAARGSRVSHAYQNPGSYTVKLTVQDDSTSSSDKAGDELTVIVNFPPVARAGEDQLVTASEVTFNGAQSMDEDGTIIGYFWDFGDSTTSTDPAPTHVYRRPGGYLVKLTVTDDSGTATNRTADELRVVVNEIPIADAGADQIGAPGQNLEFDGSRSFDPDGQIATYAWEFGDGTRASGQKAPHIFKRPGIYSVRLSVQDNTGHPLAVDHDEVIVTINVPPVAAAGKNILAAPGQMIAFDGSGSYDPDGKISRCRWSFSDGAGAVEGSKTNRTFPAPGIFTATLTVADDSGAINATAQDTIEVHINCRPEARLGPDILTCDAAVLFDGSRSADGDGHPLSYSWDFGDGAALAAGVKVLHTYQKSGTYPVVLTVDDGTGLANAKHSASLTVTINAPPMAEAGKNRTICAGDMVLFDGGGSIDPEKRLLKYHWDFGDGTAAEGVNPTKIYKTGGVFQVALTVKDDSGLPCNSDTDQIVVRVAESPVADAGPDQTVCANTVVQCDGSKSRDFDGLVNNFSWDFGDGISGGGANPTHVYTKPGVYRVLLTITGDQIGDCDNSDSDEMILTIVDAPQAKFSYNRAVPVNTPVGFDATASSSQAAKIIGWKWDFGDGTSGEGAKALHTYAEAGKYFVKMTVRTDSQTGCNATSFQDYIIVNAAPMAEAGEDQHLAVLQTAVFNGSKSRDPDGSIASYQWDFGDGETAPGVEVRHQYKKSGRYQVKLTVKDNTELANCLGIDSILITVKSAPVSVIEVTDWVCAGQEVSLNGRKSTGDGEKIANWQWDFGDGQTAEGVDIGHAFAAPGKYAVTLTVDNGAGLINSKGTATKIVRINHPPKAAAGPDQTTCPGKSVALSAAGSYDQDGTIARYAWSFGDGGTAEGEQVAHVYEKPGRYEVRLRVSDNSGIPCGVVEDTAVVVVNFPPVADAGPDLVAYLGGARDAVQFDGTKSRDPDGDPLTYFWDFGDGTKEQGARVSHTYQKPGKYTVRLVVRDSSRTPCGEAWDEMVVEVKQR